LTLPGTVGRSIRAVQFHSVSVHRGTIIVERDHIGVIGA
jgi:hypothetical protein